MDQLTSSTQTVVIDNEYKAIPSDNQVVHEIVQKKPFPITYWNNRKDYMTVALKELNNSKNIKSEDLNESSCLGMIMWKLMIGRRPFWDRNHDTELIIEICRPPIVKKNAPEGYIEIMKNVAF
ncbi:hypothetical protein C1645_818737 [Glomus cerebriforme]|uniref:Protein kinase domain-containing protein n=1 Tax=Glomus cerebriforme TaxID=658196 RepID=A0A397T7Z2_9GLOM|nr:hypothetical protein C1645_818737 [Glomus cerebriforme]